jgi:hypothetical protein
MNLGLTTTHKPWGLHTIVWDHHVQLGFIDSYRDGSTRAFTADGFKSQVVTSQVAGIAWLTGKGISELPHDI